jgi:hypothetical protein
VTTGRSVGRCDDNTTTYPSVPTAALGTVNTRRAALASSSDTALPVTRPPPPLACAMNSRVPLAGSIAGESRITRADTRRPAGVTIATVDPVCSDTAADSGTRPHLARRHARDGIVHGKQATRLCVARRHDAVERGHHTRQFHGMLRLTARDLGELEAVLGVVELRTGDAA